MEAKNLADLYNLPPMDWAAVEARLEQGITMAPHSRSPAVARLPDHAAQGDRPWDRHARRRHALGVLATSRAPIRSASAADSTDGPQQHQQAVTDPTRLQRGG